MALQGRRSCKAKPRPRANARCGSESRHGIWQAGRSGLVFYVPMEPGSCVAPESVAGSWRNAKELGRLGDGQTTEIAQFDDLGRHVVGAVEFLKRFIECQQIFLGLRSKQFGLLELAPSHTAPPFEAA